jgi:hypothetical protein
MVGVHPKTAITTSSTIGALVGLGLVWAYLVYIQIRSTGRNVLVYLEGTLLRGNFPLQRVGHFKSGMPLGTGILALFLYTYRLTTFLFFTG